MEQLQNFKSFHLHEKLCLNDNDFDEWLKELGLLHGKRTCHKCGGRSTFQALKGQRYGNWRCTTKKCRAAKGYLCGTFFEGSHLTTKQIFHLSYLWAHRSGKYEEMEFQTDISQHTITDWFNFFRGVCAEHFIRNPVQIGGEGNILFVE